MRKAHRRSEGVIDAGTGDVEEDPAVAIGCGARSIDEGGQRGARVDAPTSLSAGGGGVGARCSLVGPRRAAHRSSVRRFYWKRPLADVATKPPV